MYHLNNGFQEKKDMTWMGNDNECDYKLKLHFKSITYTVNEPYKKFYFMQVASNLKMSHLFQNKIDSITQLMHQLNNNSNSQTKRALTKPKGRYKNP